MRLSEDALEFFGENTPLEQLMSGLSEGDTLPAAALLSALETESEEILEQGFQLLEDRNVILDISGLPKMWGSGEQAVRLKLEEQLVGSGRLPEGLDAEDPLRMYLDEVAAIPLQEDFQLLTARLARDNADGKNDPRLWEQILHLSLYRVVELACRHTGCGILLLDLIQEGSMGLWQSLSYYREGDFSPFRDRWILWSMAKAVVLQAKEFGIGQKMRQAMEDYRAMDEKLLADLGRTPTMEEMAESLHMTVPETGAVAEMLDVARRIHRAKQEPEPEEEELAETQAVEDTAYFQMRQRISDLLSNLEETDAKLLSLRFGLETGSPMSGAEVAKQLGLTPDAVAAREAAALAKLRNEG